DFRRFVQTDAGDLGFAYIGFDEDFGEIGDDSDHRTGIVHRAGDDHFAFVGVELHGFAGDRGKDGGVIEVGLGLLQKRLGLIDAFVEVDLLDLADDMRADVDLDLRIDLAGRGDDRLDVAQRHRLDVDTLAPRTAALHARKDDDRDQHDRADDDESLLHLLARSDWSAGP